ncbi:hypothetical protein ABKV19_025921 [Rosa sericea]
MRCTQELREVFVEAVNQLGGGERVTPKGILNVMMVEGFTMYHVKSHLQVHSSHVFSHPPITFSWPEDLELALEAKKLQVQHGNSTVNAFSSMYDFPQGLESC